MGRDAFEEMKLLVLRLRRRVLTLDGPFFWTFTPSQEYTLRAKKADGSFESIPFTMLRPLLHGTDRWKPEDA